MNITRTLSIAVSALALFLIGDAPRYHAQAPLGLQLVSEAQAVLGVRRRTARRSAVVGYSAGAASTSAAAGAAYSEGATDQKKADASAQQQAPVPASAATNEPLPIGTVTQSLPPGCTSTPVGDVSYYYCGGNFYRAVLSGNSLVYVTAKP